VPDFGKGADVVEMRLAGEDGRTLGCHIAAIAAAQPAGAVAAAQANVAIAATQPVGVVAAQDAVAVAADQRVAAVAAVEDVEPGRAGPVACPPLRALLPPLRRPALAGRL
jgi:hypothetical protein